MGKMYEGSTEFRRHIGSKVRRLSRSEVMQDILCLVLGTVLNAFCIFTHWTVYNDSLR